MMLLYAKLCIVYPRKHLWDPVNRAAPELVFHISYSNTIPAKKQKQCARKRKSYDFSHPQHEKTPILSGEQSNRYKKAAHPIGRTAFGAARQIRITAAVFREIGTAEKV